jgi:hypothetical protein
VTSYDFALLNVLRPSGGLYYHGKAFLNARRWDPFREQVNGWLETWPCPKERGLLLIGPSAGYSLPTDWIRSFTSIDAFDRDPLARVMFHFRHQVPARFHRVNLFWRKRKLSLEPIKEILTLHPRANILFCNVLGQVLKEGRATEEEWLEFLKQLRLLLRGRSWASYHDVLSVSGNQGVDHMTAGDWINGLRPHDMNWQITRQRLHKIHGVWESPGG